MREFQAHGEDPTRCVAYMGQLLYIFNDICRFADRYPICQAMVMDPEQASIDIITPFAEERLKLFNLVLGDQPPPISQVEQKIQKFS